MRRYPASDAALAAGGGSALVRLSPRWQLGVAAAPGGGGAYVSFVNGVATARGGTHVDHIERQLLRGLAARLAAKGEEPLPPAALRPHLLLFVDGRVEDPEFDSQAKERLTSPADRWGGGPPPEVL